MMAHEFETGFFTGVPAWHKLGTVLEGAPSIQEAIVASGTDWNVCEKPLYVDQGQLFGIGKNGKNRKADCVSAELVKTHKSIVRESDGRVLGIVGKDYVPVQNKEAFQWFDFLLENGDATLEAGGSLRNGQRIWVLAKMKGEAGDVVKSDTVESYLLLSNAHDGTMSVWISFTPIRVVCMNTLTAALSNIERQAERGKAIKIRHTASVDRQLKYAQELVDTSRHVFDNSMESYKLFAKTGMTDKQFDEFIQKVLYGKHKVNIEKEMEEERNEMPREALLKKLFEAGKGQDIPGVRGTVWAGYNAFTEYVDHHRGRTDESRLDGSWYGDGNRMRKRAYNEALELVKKA